MSVLPDDVDRSLTMKPLAMKRELADFAVSALSRAGFSGRGATLRVIGEDLQWVARVEKVSHVDQVNIEIGIVFQSSPLAGRRDCRVLWSLSDFIGVESDDLARALLPKADYSLAEGESLVRDAIAHLADFVHAHTTLAQVASAYAEGQFAKAFMFEDARELLESVRTEAGLRPGVAELIDLGPMPTDAEAVADPARADRWEQLLSELTAAGDVTDAEAAALLRLFPRDDGDSFGLAWGLVHLIESAPSWPLIGALAAATGPWSRVLRQRASLSDLRAAVVLVADLLVRGDYATVERMTDGRRLSGADLERAVREYGRTLAPLPQEALTSLDVDEVLGSEPARYAVVIDLWTQEEGRSDLSLELELEERSNGAYDVSIQDLHVL